MCVPLIMDLLAETGVLFSKFEMWREGLAISRVTGNLPSCAGVETNVGDGNSMNS